MIITNSAQCLICGNILVSESVHDYKTCKCGNIFVDGGNEYIRHGWRHKNFYVNLSEEHRDSRSHSN